VVRLLCEVRLAILLFSIVSTLSDASKTGAPALIALLAAPFSYFPARSWKSRGDLFMRSGILLAADLVAAVVVIVVMGGSELMVVYAAATVALWGVMVGVRLALVMAAPIALALLTAHGSAGVRWPVILVGTAGVAAMAWAGNTLGVALRAQASTARELAEIRSHRAVVLERVRLARDLHDTVAGDLAGVVLLSQALRRRLDDDGGSEVVLRLAQQLDAACTTAHMDTRIALGELRRAEIDPVESLMGLCRQWSDRTGVVAVARVDSALDGVCPTLVDDVRAMLLELLENVRRHADAEAVQIDIVMSDGQVVLRVRDDGKGIESDPLDAGRDLDEDASRVHFGLVGIRERAVARGGSATVTGVPRKGTIVQIALPIEAPGVRLP
jgi:signal transduction histidine kinase